MSHQSLLLPGLDAQNPLGFLAALGLLRVLDEHALAGRRQRPWLSFDNDAIACVGCELTREQVAQVVLEDAKAQGLNPVLNLAYADEKRTKRDLKPPPELARRLLDECSAADRRTADLAAAVFSELVQDNNGNTKPTALHFTAGQQEFLDMVSELRKSITLDDVREAIDGPWRTESKLPSLAWDSSVTRLYALRANAPSKEPRGSVPAANWLAVQALTFLPVLARRGRLMTTCVKGGWKDSTFTWPLWRGTLRAPVVASVLRMNVFELTAGERRAAGISAVFSARILRSEQGGYGSFAPASVVLPEGSGGDVDEE